MELKNDPSPKVESTVASSTGSTVQRAKPLSHDDPVHHNCNCCCNCCCCCKVLVVVVVVVVVAAAAAAAPTAVFCLFLFL